MNAIVQTLASWFAKVLTFLTSIVQALEDAFTWLLDLLIYIPKKAFEGMMGAFAGVIAAIPAPDFVTNLPALFAAIPEPMRWGFGVAQVGAGLTMVGSAYLLRFIIRRIPFIG
jgi:hypothetical protein